MVLFYKIPWGNFTFSLPVFSPVYCLEAADLHILWAYWVSSVRSASALQLCLNKVTHPRKNPLCGNWYPIPSRHPLIVGKHHSFAQCLNDGLPELSWQEHEMTRDQIPPLLPSQRARIGQVLWGLEGLGRNKVGESERNDKFGWTAPGSSAFSQVMQWLGRQLGSVCRGES